MQRVAFFLVLLLGLGRAGWGQPTSPTDTLGLQKQVSFATERKPHAYYVRQAEGWWAAVQQNPRSETNWFNYYRACRNAQGTADWREDFVRESPALRLGADIVPLMKAAIPDTFTYYFVAGSTGGVASEGDLLLKAYRLNPDFEGIQAAMATYATTTRNLPLRQEVNRRWLARHELSPGLLAYAYNVLCSLQPGAILLTEHDNDTYPLWLLQDARHIRPDVVVINIDFLLDAGFRTATFRQLGIVPLQLGAIHVNDYAQNWEKVVHHFVTHYQTKRPLYLAMSLSPTRYQGLTTHLHPTGLAWLYAPGRPATAKLNCSLFADKFLLDYLTVRLGRDTGQAFVQELNLNYLPMLRDCHAYYRRTGNSRQLGRIRRLATSIMAAAGNAQLRSTYAALLRP